MRSLSITLSQFLAIPVWYNGFLVTENHLINFTETCMTANVLVKFFLLSKGCLSQFFFSGLLSLMPEKELNQARWMSVCRLLDNLIHLQSAKRPLSSDGICNISIIRCTVDCRVNKVSYFGTLFAITISLLFNLVDFAMYHVWVLLLSCGLHLACSIAEWMENYNHKYLSLHVTLITLDCDKSKLKLSTKTGKNARATVCLLYTIWKLL